MPISKTSSRKAGPAPGFEGIVVSSVAVWLKDNAGKSTKYFDTKVEFDDGTGTKRAQVFVRPFDYLPPDSLVRVRRSKSGKLRIVPMLDETIEPGADWKKPDIRTGVIAIALGVLIIVSIIGGAFLYLKFSEKQVEDLINGQNEQPPATSQQGPTPSPTA